jgi:hypothetical protein
LQGEDVKEEEIHPQIKLEPMEKERLAYISLYDKSSLGIFLLVHHRSMHGQKHFLIDMGLCALQDLDPLATTPVRRFEDEHALSCASCALRLLSLLKRFEFRRHAPSLRDEQTLPLGHEHRQRLK